MGREIRKFWNFVDSGDTAQLQLFGTIQSDEDWWSGDCVTYRDFIGELDGLGDKKEIEVVIQSAGGDVFAANAIYSALAMNRARITGTVIGICASAATIVLMACDSRRIAKNAVLMAHNPAVSLRGSYRSDELLKLAEATEQVKKSIVSAYMGRLGRTEEEISRLMDEESWYVGQEAVDAGFCDSVIEMGFRNSAIADRIMVDGTSYSFRNYLERFVPENIRKKVQDVTQEGSADMGEKDEKDEKGEGAPVISDAGELKAAYPALCGQIAGEAARAERERLKAIDEIAGGIPEGMLRKAKYEEPVSAADLALARMKADSAAGRRFLEQMAEDMQDSGAAAVGAEPGTEGQEKAENARKVAGFAAKLKGDRRRGALKRAGEV